MRSKTIFVIAIALMIGVANVACATITRGIDIEFVTIGSAGNPGDISDTASPIGCGSVSYEYQIGKYEVTIAQWDAFVSAAGAPMGIPHSAYFNSSNLSDPQQPINYVSWLEAIQFSNYLTSGDKSQGAYLFDGNNINPGNFLGIDRNSAISAYGVAYVIPTEDEWYKAAYYKPDGSGYSIYANGMTVSYPPEFDVDSNYNLGGPGPYPLPWNVGTGKMEQNGTFDMMGNVSEWNETQNGHYRVYRGGGYRSIGRSALRSSYRYAAYVNNENTEIGFRIASVPEPGTVLLLGLGTLLLRKRKLEPSR